MFAQARVGIPQHRPQKAQPQRPLNNPVLGTAESFLIEVGRDGDARQTSRTTGECIGPVAAVTQREKAGRHGKHGTA